MLELIGWDVVYMLFAKNLVAQLIDTSSISNGDIQGSNSPSPNYQIIKKGQRVTCASSKACFS